MKSHLKLMILPSAKKLGDLVKRGLDVSEDCVLNFECDRFCNGEGKVKIHDFVDFCDLYILCDIGNYEMNYLLHGVKHSISPDEHFADLKRAIAATSGCASKIHVIMPLLYESRQHKRKGFESLDCAMALQELENMGVDSIITFDVHDPSICNAVPKLCFKNYYPTEVFVKKILENEKLIDSIVVSPDMGAMERARFFAEILCCDIGVFYKRRDLSKVIDGKNPIVEHVYMGNDIKGKDILVVDDMIASGTSMLEVARLLKEKGAHKIFFITTFALFTEGISEFQKAYQAGYFDKLYTTNLSYIPTQIQQEEWFCSVDMSLLIAQIIESVYHHKPFVEKGRIL